MSAIVKFSEHQEQVQQQLDDSERRDRAFGVAMADLTLARANADRALRDQPPLNSPLDINPYQAAQYHAAGLEMVLRQQPGAVLAAVNDAAEQLRAEVARVVVADPGAAIVNDAERMKDAAAAWVRRALETFRASLAAELPALRGRA